jgi:hypothetical protein
MATKQHERQTPALERGNIFFFYRPRVRPPGEDWIPKGVNDIARSYIVLHPKGKAIYRLIVVPKKRLPDVNKHEREWGFVEKVSRKPGEIERELQQEIYETITRGERVVPAARPAGEGVYELVRHVDHTHIAYALELPEKPGPVQEELNIKPEASFIVSVKNPEAPSPPGTGLPEDEAAKYPPSLETLFQGRRFVPVDPPDLLDYPGAQLLLIGAAADVRAELGIELNPERETERTAEIFQDLHLAKSKTKLDPLTKGKWA